MLAAGKAGSEFEEPAILRLASGRLLMLLRDNGTRRLHRVVSDDEGASWSPPASHCRSRAIRPHLLGLPDGRLLCTYGWRQPDFGIRAVLSARRRRELGHRARRSASAAACPTRIWAIPARVLDGDGSLFTVYYGQDGDGVTCIQATRWRL